MANQEEGGQEGESRFDRLVERAAQSIVATMRAIDESLDTAPGQLVEKLIHPLTLFLDTDAGTFANWLARYTRLAYLEPFSTGRGRIILQPARPFASRGAEIALQMKGTYITTGDQDATAEKAQLIAPPIVFELVPLGAGRIELTARCSQPVVTPYFRKLLLEIGRRWPESAPDIEAHVGKADEEAVPVGRAVERKSTERNYGPTEKVWELADTAKRVKDANPTKSMLQVALELHTTPDAIRYAYRVMSWKWERADRVRAKR